MKPTIETRFRIAISESTCKNTFYGHLSYNEVEEDYSDLVDNGVASLKLIEFIRLYLPGVNLEWLLLGEGNKTSWNKQWHEKWNEWWALKQKHEVLQKEHDALLERVEKSGLSLPEEPKAKVIRMTPK